ncbi:IS1380 family transposase [Paenibacillus sinopodophylli]|uniref:IS1380 family transposase n=1 Tax=Paenibacillus sinopodophylli TaxID=1837342 RepID=UPI00110D0819|nr:IS1380 family transposase [Paenibacillus sinopodophylli]
MNSTTKIKSLKTEFSVRNATNFAGSKVILGFLEAIHLNQALQTLGLAKAANAIYPTHRIFQYLIIGWLLGCERLFHFVWLQEDALVKHALGGRLPHHTLLNKELLRLGAAHDELAPALRKLNVEMIAPRLPDSLILDLDSTVETVYGNQQGAEVGFISQKRGRKSYHPLLVYEGQSRMLLGATLRPGNTSSSTDVLSFVEQTLDVLGDRKVCYARFDKGFGGEDFYAFWEAQQIGYVGKMKWTERLLQQVQACEHWTRFVDDEWVIEGLVLCYQATTWKKARRVAVIRKMQRFDGDQSMLELDLLWQYEAMVTTEAWESIDVWRFYNQRCCMENYIKEGKNGFSIHRIPTQSFAANEIDLLLKLLAYNLFECFKHHCCDPIRQSYTKQRFRREVFRRAGLLVRHGRQTTLKLATSFRNQSGWRRMEKKSILLE